MTSQEEYESMADALAEQIAIGERHRKGVDKLFETLRKLNQDARILGLKVRDPFALVARWHSIVHVRSGGHASFASLAMAHSTRDGWEDPARGQGYLATWPSPDCICESVDIGIGFIYSNEVDCPQHGDPELFLCSCVSWVPGMREGDERDPDCVIHYEDSVVRSSLPEFDKRNRRIIQHGPDRGRVRSLDPAFTEEADL